MLNHDRLTQTLIELVKIDSISRREKDVADRLQAMLKDSGCSFEVDDAGGKVKGNSGNLIVRRKGANGNAPPLFLSAHMDTVEPGIGVKPILTADGILKTDGTTVLGGDDKSGCAIIVETLRTIHEKNLGVGDIEVVFTICEEVGLLGAKHFDPARIQAKVGLVLDSDDPGCLFVKAPASDRFEAKVFGAAAHAGVAPETGISAIRVAAEGIARMKLGRIDEETTANIGVIHGGIATNIIPPEVTLRGEARSHDEKKLAAQTAHMIECLKNAAAFHKLAAGEIRREARVEANAWREYGPMNVDPQAQIVQLVMAAAAKAGAPISAGATGGGCDANVFNSKGLLAANLGTGMQKIHTVEEFLRVADMHRSGEIVLEVLRMNATG